MTGVGGAGVPRGARRLGPSIFVTRSRISLAALLVNVTAKMRSGGVPWRIKLAMR